MLELESAWKKATSEWTCPLLMVNRLVAQHVFMRRVDPTAYNLGRRSVFHCLDAFLTGDVNALLKHENKRGGAGSRG
ncbi:MAG: hypothetical protein RL328_790 [Acidobacteriota bacterium]